MKEGRKKDCQDSNQATLNIDIDTLRECLKQDSSLPPQLGLWLAFCALPNSFSFLLLFCCGHIRIQPFRENRNLIQQDPCSLPKAKEQNKPRRKSSGSFLKSISKFSSLNLFFDQLKKLNEKKKLFPVRFAGKKSSKFSWPSMKFSLKMKNLQRFQGQRSRKVPGKNSQGLKGKKPRKVPRENPQGFPTFY